MLKLFPHRDSNCEHSRRQFMLEVGSIAGTGLSLDMLLRAKAARAEASGVKAGDVKCIFIWTLGGTSHRCADLGVDVGSDSPRAVAG